MKAYFSILRQQMIGQMQYRAGFWAGISTHIFWGVARAAILVAFYLYGQGEADITMRQAVSMVWLQQLAGVLVPGWNTNADAALYNQLRTGDVAYELLRPLDAYTHWYVRSIAGRIGTFLLELVPILGIGLLVPEPWGLGAPVSPLHALACLITLLSGLFTSCAMILLSYAMVLDVRVGDAPSRMAACASRCAFCPMLPSSSPQRMPSGASSACALS